MKINKVPLQVIARGPFMIYYEGDAEVVSATNRVGKFDILPGHASFFSLIDPGEVIITTANDEINVPVSNGIVCVEDDEVLLFLNL